MELNFSLNSMNGLESEIGKMLSTFSFKNLDDVSKASFSAVNKNSVVDLTKYLAALLARSQDLLKHAAGDLDSLKCDQIKIQSKLLEVQDEISVKKTDQLKEVKTVVEEKLSSWTEVVKKGTVSSNQSISLTPKKLKQAVKTAIQDSDRGRNVMMFNVPEENEDGSSSNNFDHSSTLQIMYSTGLMKRCEISVERIGEHIAGKCRPLRVFTGSETIVFELSKGAKRLKDTACYQIFIQPDRSREERVEHKKLVQMLKQKRAQYPDTKFFIKNNKICSSE